MMKRIFVAALAALFSTGAIAQQIAPGTVMGNSRATQGPARQETVTAILDSAFTAVNGTVLCRTAGAWNDCSAVTLGIAGTTIGTLGLSGNTSGLVTITPQAAAGTPTLTLPNTSGTFAVGATAPLALSATTGGLTVNANGITDAFIRQGAAISVIGRSANSIGNVADIAATVDGHVLRRAASALGFGQLDLSFSNTWGSSILGLANGGTNAALTANNGGIVYSGAAGLAILNNPGISGPLLQFQNAAAPISTASTYPSASGAGSILSALTANAITATRSPVVGLAGTAVGTLGFENATSGRITLSPPTGALGTVTLTLPAAADTLVGRATTDTLTNKTISGASNTLSNIALSSLATQGNYTFVVNNTGGSASPTAVEVGTMTTKASPAAGDYLILSDQAASGALKKATVSSVAAGAAVASLNGQTGAIITGLDVLQNASLAVSAAGSALTIALKDSTGADPSAGSAVAINFRNATGTTGTHSTLAVTAATSLVVSSGSTLGVTSSTAFRLWVVGFNDAGTFRLGVINCFDGNSVFPLNESLASSTAEVPAFSCRFCRNRTTSKPSRYTLVKPSATRPSVAPAPVLARSLRRWRWCRPIHSLQ